MSDPPRRIPPGSLDLMGIREVAGLFGVRPQRIHQLMRDHRDFPRPVIRLQMGPVFCAVSIREFLANWDRRPGRPPIRRRVATRRSA